MDKVERYKEILEAEAESHHVPILRETERKLFLSVLEKSKPVRILEIGTAIGYSTLLLAAHAPQAVIDTVEIDEGRYKRAMSVVDDLGLSCRVHCHLGDAAQVIPTLFPGYDFVFLDGPKGQYMTYIKLIEPLLADEAVVVADNVLFRGMVVGNEYPPHRYRTIVLRLREYISYMKSHYETTIHAAGDGLAVSLKGNRKI